MTISSNDYKCTKLCEVDRYEWRIHWTRVVNTNLLQSWEYGDAKAAAEGWRPVRFLFKNSLGEPLALAQVLTRTWPLVGGAARLNRGPLLLENVANSSDSDKFVIDMLNLLRIESRRRRWWLFYVAPELNEKDVSQEILREIGFRPRKHQTPWSSACVSLLEEEDALFANLKSKWRNLLRKAQKSDLVLRHWDGSERDVEIVVEYYRRIQQEKGFDGISEDLLRALSRQDGDDWRFKIYFTIRDSNSSNPNELIGILVSVIHGDKATYLIGLTTDFGRKYNANYLMLWQSIIDSRRHGCRWYDLGGITSNTPKGVAHFKRGLRGQEYNLIGEYFYSLLLY